MFPLLLLVPNFILNLTERLPVVVSMANIFLPLGFYALLLSISRRVGVAVLCCLPFMIFSAFQIVLLYLYGESIIAVDMFLNVVTTNPREVSELLGNLLEAIGTVVVLYVPAIVWATILVIKRINLSWAFMRIYRRCALAATAVGVVFVILAYFIARGFSIDEDIFPANVISNLVTAVKRTAASETYPLTSANFRFGAVTERDSLSREVYVLVVGETSRADNWQLLGYDRETNPRLSHVGRLVAFPRALTQSNTTHKSVPMLLSDLTAANFDSIAHRKSIITAFNEAGYSTAFFSNQRRNGSYIDYFGHEADTTIFIKDDGVEHFDADLLGLFRDRLADTTLRKQLIVLHTYGSHFNYRDRYDDSFSHFKPDQVVDANSSHRSELINAFDNTIRYIDSYLAQIMDEISRSGVSGALLYAADHGEDIFDDERGRFLHASPSPTATQLHVPMLVWLSESYDGDHPGKLASLCSNRDSMVTPSVSLFHTLADLAGLRFDAFNPKHSLASDRYVFPGWFYLTDRNQLVPLTESGLKDLDVQRLREKRLM